MINIEFIVPSWCRPHNLACLIQSFIVQTSVNWKLYIISDSKEDTAIPLIEKYVTNYPEFIRHSILEKGPHKDWGHEARAYGLDNAEEEWIVMTSDDNYYMPTFVDTFIKYIKFKKDKNFFVCKCLHNLVINYSKVLEGDLIFQQIDIGQFCIRTDIAQKLGYTERTTYEADWFFVEKYLLTYGLDGVCKIPNILYVHN